MRAQQTTGKCKKNNNQTGGIKDNGVSIGITTADKWAWRTTFAL